MIRLINTILAVILLAFFSGHSYGQQSELNQKKEEIIIDDDKYGLVDYNDQLLLKPSFDTIYRLNKNDFALSVNNKWGIYSQGRNILINPLYDFIVGYEIILPTRLPKDKYLNYLQYYPRNKKYDKLGLLFTVNNNRVGVVNYEGDVILDTSYDLVYLQEYFKGLKKNYYLELLKDDKKGLSSIDGNLHINPKYNKILWVDDTIACKDSIRATLFNTELLKIELPFVIQDFETCGYGKSIEIISDGRRGIYKDNEILIEPKYDEINCDLLVPGYETNINSNYGFINSNGLIVTEPIYDEIEFTSGGIVVKKDGQVGVLKLDGTELVEVSFDSIEFTPSLFKYHDYKLKGFVVSDGPKKGFILEDGAPFLPVEYDEIDNVGSGLIIRKGQLKGYMTINKEKLLPVEFQDIRVWKSGHTIIVRKNDKEGLYDINGKEVLPIEFDRLTLYPSNVLLVKKYNKYGLYTSEGLELMEPKWLDYKMKRRGKASFYDGKRWTQFSISKLAESIKSKSEYDD